MIKLARRLLMMDAHGCAHVCPSWLAFFVDNPFRNLFQDPRKILSRFDLKGCTVLDIGCGPGFFSLAMARMVGEKGKVIAIDLQEKMLEKLKHKAGKAGLMKRIRFHQCREESLGIRQKADFILACWMVHEVPDKLNLFRQIRRLLKPRAYFLLMEPKLHVMAGQYVRIVGTAIKAGLRPVSELKVRFSRATVFQARKSCSSRKATSRRK